MGKHKKGVAVNILMVPCSIDGHKGSIGSKMLRHDWILESGRTVGSFKIDTYDETVNLEDYDAMFLQKAYKNPELLKNVELFKKRGGLVVFDTCDPIHKQKEFKRILKYVDLFTCSSDKLYEELSDIRPTLLLIDRINITVVTPKTKKFPIKPKTIYFGYSNNYVGDLREPDIFLSDKDIGVGKFIKWDENWRKNLVLGDILLYEIKNEYKKSVLPTNRMIISWWNGLVVAKTKEEIELYQDVKQRKKEVLYRKMLVFNKYTSMHSYYELINFIKRWKT